MYNTYPGNHNQAPSQAAELIAQAAEVVGIDAVKLRGNSESVVLDGKTPLSENAVMNMRNGTSQELMTLIGAGKYGIFGLSRISAMDSRGGVRTDLALIRLADGAPGRAQLIGVVGKGDEPIALPGEDGKNVMSIVRSSSGHVLISSHTSHEVSVLYASGANIAPQEGDLTISAIGRYWGKAPKDTHNPLDSRQAQQLWSVPSETIAEWFVGR